MRIAGSYVASVIVLEDGGRLSWIVTRDLRTGRATDQWQAAAGQSPLATDSDITDLVLTSTGSTAFIEGFGGPGAFLPATRFVVRKHDSTGRSVLEDSTTVDPASLALDGTAIRWMTAGTQRAIPIH